ncbi:MAG TPA: CAP domain-containing protein, partial [Solirubrobacteraceae bacterium]|nr:CAP domain-containing protein [Solirubrobacteraceae bacterium]
AAHRIVARLVRYVSCAALAFVPKSIVRGWMGSPGHRHAILDDSFRDVGVGVAPGAPRKVRGRAATYTTEFGYRVMSD